MSETIRLLRNRALCWRTWLHGLFGAFIQSGATAISVMAVDPEKFNLGQGLSNIGKVVLLSGLAGAALYLKQSPVPPIESETKP